MTKGNARLGEPCRLLLVEPLGLLEPTTIFVRGGRTDEGIGGEVIADCIGANPRGGRGGGGEEEEEARGGEEGEEEEITGEEWWGSDDANCFSIDLGKKGTSSLGKTPEIGLAGPFRGALFKFGEEVALPFEKPGFEKERPFLFANFKRKT